MIARNPVVPQTEKEMMQAKKKLKMTKSQRNTSIEGIILKITGGEEEVEERREKKTTEERKRVERMKSLVH